MSTQPQGNNARQAVTHDLREKIRSGVYGPGSMLPSRRNLAKQYGVAPGTVEQAISKLLADGLLNVDSRRGTFVSHAAVVPGGSRTQTVAGLFSHIAESPQSNYLAGFRSALQEEAHMLIFDTQDDPRIELSLLDRVDDWDGFVGYMTGAELTLPRLSALIAEGKPIVFVDRYPYIPHVDAVVTDYYGSTFAAMQVLFEQGHQRIALFTENALGVSSIRELNSAYRDALIGIGQNPDKWFRRYPQGVGMDEAIRAQLVQDSLAAMFNDSEPPTAALCLYDGYMGAVLDGCDRLGIDTPGQLQLVSYCDLPNTTRRISNSVHRIVQRVRAMGVFAAERMDAKLKGQVLGPTITRMPADMILVGQSQPMPLIGPVRPTKESL